jgi:hypothetical protein
MHSTTVTSPKRDATARTLTAKISETLRRIPSKFYVDLGDWRRTVVLAGTGRSGTTWVGDLLNSHNTYRVMFEPFHARKIPLLRDWSYRQYLRPEDTDEIYLSAARSILSGNIRHSWIDQYNRRIVARRRLIKDIRAQLFLGWIKHHFPEIQIILLLRHPCAVANSKIKLNWATHLECFLSQPKLMADFLAPFRHIIESAVDPFERHIVMWCVENYVPLRQFRDGGLHVAFYEHLCVNPAAEAAELMRVIGESYSDQVHRTLERPSAVTRADSAIRSGSSLTDSWRREVSKDQLERAVSILHSFGLDSIYSEASLPHVEGHDAVRRFGASDGH